MKKHESARKSYIRLLKERVDFPDSLTKEQRDLVLSAELIGEGYLDGEVIQNSGGIFPANVIIGLPKPKGRLFLQQLEQEEHDATLIGKIEKKTDILIGFILGIIGSVAGAIILRLLHLS